MDDSTKKIVAALRQAATKQLTGMPEEKQPDALTNIKTTDLVAVLDALDAAGNS